MDGGGVTDNYLEESWWRPRDPWVAGFVRVSGNPPTGEDQRIPYTYGASRKSLRPTVDHRFDDEIDSPPRKQRKTKRVKARKPTPKKRKPWTPMPRQRPFKLQPFDLEPATARPAPEVLPPTRIKNRGTTIQPNQGFQPPTGNDVLDLLDEIGDGPFPETVYPPNKKGFR